MLLVNLSTKKEKNNFINFSRTHFTLFQGCDYTSLSSQLNYSNKAIGKYNYIA